MHKYEILLDTAKQDGVTVTEQFDLSDTRFKVLYCDGVIAIDHTLATSAEKNGILAEELGHHYTSYGDIIAAYNHRCTSLLEMAEFLEVTEEFLAEALERYRSKYGCYVKLDNYVIYFEPVLGVLEMI